VRAAAATAIVLLLAGCTHAAHPVAAPAMSPGPVLHGAVLDPALRPIAGATVLVPAANASTSTNAEGLYSFDALPRGQVLVVTAAHPGHVAGSRQVTLPDAGDLKLDIVLEIVPTQGAYRDVLKFDGLVTCQAAVVVSQDDPQPTDCGAPAADPGRTVWDFAASPNLASAVVEVTWKAGTPLAEGLGGRIDRVAGGNATPLAQAVSRSPMRLVVPVDTARRYYGPSGGDLRLTVYAMPITQEDEQAAAAALAVDQSFQAFASLFYGAPPDPTYSFVNATSG